MHLISSSMIIIVVSELNSNCPKLGPNLSFNSQQHFGVWYAVRGIEHTHQLKNKVKRNKLCPQVIITNKSNNIWEFEWTMNETRRFKLKEDPNNPGRLTKMVKGETIGQMQITTLPGVNNIWAATICKSDDTRVASAILSSTPVFKKEQVEKLTTTLHNQGLNTDYVYDRCD
ncbi:uncharacterized protein isoform X2 [Rhodnius prolixus]|uniref:uncharacterized protein isoform X2 n=1 Tax=Rhodnius prolixus TaxID=13249 RepID=UPI003D18E23F